MKYPNLRYLKLDEYSKIKNKYLGKSWILIELDGERVRNEKKLYMLFKKKITAPKHFYNNINSFNDLLYNFFDLGNPNRLVIMIKNHTNIKNTEFLSTILGIFNGAVDYWKKHDEARLEVLVFNKTIASNKYK